MNTNKERREDLLDFILNSKDGDVYETHLGHYDAQGNFFYDDEPWVHGLDEAVEDDEQILDMDGYDCDTDEEFDKLLEKASKICRDRELEKYDAIFEKMVKDGQLTTSILDAFEIYIYKNPDIEILDSQKLGLIGLHTKDLMVEQLESPEDVLYFVFYEMALNIKLENPESSTSYILLEEEKVKVKNKVNKYIDKMEDEDKVFVMTYLNDFLDDFGQ